MNPNRATVSLTIEVLIEVDDRDETTYHSAVAQAKDELRKRVVEAPTFLPLAIRSERIYIGTTVREMKDKLIVEPRREWNRR